MLINSKTRTNKSTKVAHAAVGFSGAVGVMSKKEDEERLKILDEIFDDPRERMHWSENAPGVVEYAKKSSKAYDECIGRF